jgi:hypothetical protein
VAWECVVDRDDIVETAVALGVAVTVVCFGVNDIRGVLYRCGGTVRSVGDVVSRQFWDWGLVWL